MDCVASHPSIISSHFCKEISTVRNDSGRNSDSELEGSWCVKVRCLICSHHPTLMPRNEPRKQPQPLPRAPGTPRRRKFPSSTRLQGVKPQTKSLAEISAKLVEKLKFPFTPEVWQIQLISHVQQGYDSFFGAGTGYCKSLGLAALGGKGKTVIVISPLKNGIR